MQNRNTKSTEMSENNSHYSSNDDNPFGGLDLREKEEILVSPKLIKTSTDHK